MDILTINDKAGDYPPNSYYVASGGTAPAYPMLKGEVRADVAVIGAGFTGLSTSFHLAKAGVNVVCLDANRVGWGASGRNGGQASPGLRRDQKDLKKMVGEKEAHALWDLSKQAVSHFQQMIRENQIDCDYKTGLIHANVKKSSAEAEWRYVDYLRENYGVDDIDLLDRAAMREELASEHYQGGIFLKNGGHFHPLKFCFGLARAAGKKGARFFDNSRMTKIREGELVEIETKDGRIVCDHAVLALNGYHNDIDPSQSQYVMPINNFIVATEPLDEDRAKQIIRSLSAIADDYFVVNYFRFSSDFRMLFGGGENYRYRFPKRMDQIAYERMTRILPQLDDTKIDYFWGGTLGITVNRMPAFQRVSKNIYSASGYSGQGVILANYAGKLLSDAILTHSSSFELLERVRPRQFPGGAALRWPLLFLALFAASMRDKM